MGHNYIGTEHLLLGLFGQPEGLAAQILAGTGVTHAAVKAKVVGRLLAFIGEDVSAPSEGIVLLHQRAAWWRPSTYPRNGRKMLYPRSSWSFGSSVRITSSPIAVMWFSWAAPRGAVLEDHRGAARRCGWLRRRATPCPT